MHESKIKINNPRRDVYYGRELVRGQFVMCANGGDTIYQVTARINCGSHLQLVSIKNGNAYQLRPGSQYRILDPRELSFDFRGE